MLRKLQNLSVGTALRGCRQWVYPSRGRPATEKLEQLHLMLQQTDTVFLVSEKLKKRLHPPNYLIPNNSVIAASCCL